MVTLSSSTEPKTKNETLLFFKRWLRHPLRMGAVIPSSPALTRLVSQNVNLRGGPIVELGAGTGCLTRSLLEAGIPAEKIIIVELDPALCDHLKETFPQLQIYQGNATNLPDLLPEDVVGQVSTVISGLPMTAMPFGVQRQIIDACFNIMDVEGDILQYTYRPVSPLSTQKLGLKKERVGLILKNLPPATVWRYQKPAAA